MTFTDKELAIIHRALREYSENCATEAEADQTLELMERLEASLNG